MTPVSSAEKKIYSFSAVSKKEWEKAAQSEWEGAATDQKANTQRLHGLEIKPYYDISDLPKVKVSQLPASAQSFLGARAWSNMPFVAIDGDREANQVARDWLNSGADGILFELKDDSAPKSLLKEIEIPFCTTAFLANKGQEGFFQNLSLWAKKEKKYDLQSISGAIFWKQIPAKPQELIKLFEQWKHFHALGFMVRNEASSPSDEIAGLLAKAVKQIDILTDKALDVRDAIHAIAFSVDAGPDFFLAIAKFKTLRILWSQVAKTFLPEYTSSVFIHANVHPLVQSQYEPHGNLLKSTTIAMSAIFGGCDALTIQIQSPEDNIPSRIARNISSLLREESHLSKVSDPTAGAYFLESLIDQLSQQAWEKFQRTL
jgi:methylmalonyl-CoA mutase